jgi:hypothetical protein
MYQSLTLDSHRGQLQLIETELIMDYCALNLVLQSEEKRDCHIEVT